MSINGVPQLQRLIIQSSTVGGSSAGTREFIRTMLPKLQQSHPHVQFKLEYVSNRHPVVRAKYLNGYKQQISLRNANVQEAFSLVKSLTEKTGRVISRKWPIAQTSTKSVQGVWNPAFNHVDVTEQIKEKVKPHESLLGVVIDTKKQQPKQ